MSDLHEGLAGADDGDIIGFDLVSLVRSAAQLRSGRMAFVNDAQGTEEALSFAACDDLARSNAAALHMLGLQPGECVLLAGCSGPRAFAALIGALAAGLDAAVCGLHLDAGEMGAFAKACGASAIITDAREGDAAQCELVYGAAALADNVRLIVSVAAEAPDGSVSIAAAAATGNPAPARAHARPGQIVTRDAHGNPVRHLQQTLITAGFDFLSQTRIGAGLTLLSTIPPSSFAGLVCGPVAGLLTGATTVLHAPFDSKKLIARIEADKPVQLVVPAGLAPHLEKSSLAAREHLANLVLLTRINQAPRTLENISLPRISLPGIDIADLIAFGEIAAVAESRDGDRLRSAFLQDNHTIQMDGREVIAFRAIRHLLDSNGVRSKAISLDGAAVTKADWLSHDPAA